MGLLSSGKQLGALIVDEKGERFKISGYTCKNDKSMIGTMVKGTVAVATMGASLLLDRIDRKKSVTTGWIPYEKLLSYNIRKDTAKATEKVGVAAARKGIGIGRSSSISKDVTLSCEIVVEIDSLDNPVVIIPIFDKPPKSQKEADKAQKYLDESMAALNYIARKQG